MYDLVILMYRLPFVEEHGVIHGHTILLAGVIRMHSVDDVLASLRRVTCISGDTRAFMEEFTLCFRFESLGCKLGRNLSDPRLWHDANLRLPFFRRRICSLRFDVVQISKLMY